MVSLDNNSNFVKLLSCVLRHPRNIKTNYKLIYSNGSIIDAIADTVYESDNELELDDPNYEEFDSIVFCNKATGKLFEINYHNLPASVWCDGEKVY